MSENGVTPDAGRGHDDAVVAQSVRGARLLLVRGIALRAITVPTTIMLALVVSPRQLGMLAVARGLLATATFLTELGFESALIRRPTDTTADELSALAVLRLLLLTLCVGAIIALPESVTGLSLLPPELRGWMKVLLAALAVTIFQTGCKVRLERALEFQKVSVVEILGISVENIGLLTVALLGWFDRGLFVVLAAGLAVQAVTLLFMAPPGRPRFDLRPLRAVVQDTAGFSFAALLAKAREAVTPLLVARLFGLDRAGLWSFAYRFGQVLQLTFEGQARAGIPAAARLRASVAHLRALSTGALRDGARVALPAAAALFVALPVLAIVWPKWAGSVPMAQAYVLAVAINGILWGALGPILIVQRGAVGATGEVLASLTGIWLGLALLGVSGGTNVGLCYLLGGAAGITWMISATTRSAHPDWTVLGPPVAVVAASLGLFALVHQVTSNPWVTAAIAILPAGIALVAGARHSLPRFSRRLDASQV